MIYPTHTLSPSTGPSSKPFFRACFSPASRFFPMVFNCPGVRGSSISSNPSNSSAACRAASFLTRSFCVFSISSSAALGEVS